MDPVRDQHTNRSHRCEIRFAKITACAATLLAIAASGAMPALADAPQAQSERMQTLTPTPLLVHQPKRPVHSLGMGGHDLRSALVPSQTAVVSGPTGFDWSAGAVGALAAAAAYVIAIGVVLNLNDKSYKRQNGERP